MLFAANNNFTLAINESDNNSTDFDGEETIKIVTMIGIAALLGFIILATVIGKRIKVNVRRSFFFN